MNENENTTTQNLLDTVKAVLRGRYIVVQAYLKKQVKNKIYDTMDQLDLTMNFTFFSSAHGTFSRIDHILGHKSSLGKFKKIEIIPSIFSDHNAVR